MEQPDVIHVALVIAELFDELGVRFVIGGSVASSILGESRPTMDVDFAADVRLEHVEPLALALKPPFFLDAELARDAIKRQRIFNILHIKSGIKADVHVKAYSGFEKSQMDRALRVNGSRLDFEYMREWSARLCVDDLFERALRESGLERESATP